MDNGIAIFTVVEVLHFFVFPKFSWVGVGIWKEDGHEKYLMETVFMVKKKKKRIAKESFLEKRSNIHKMEKIHYQRRWSNKAVREENYWRNLDINLQFLFLKLCTIKRLSISGSFQMYYFGRCNQWKNVWWNAKKNNFSAVRTTWILISFDTVFLCFGHFVNQVLYFDFFDAF